MRPGVRPLTPIFDPEKRTGAINIGNTPDVNCLVLAYTETDARFSGATAMAKADAFSSTAVLVALPASDTLVAVDTSGNVDEVTDATKLNGVTSIGPAGSSWIVYMDGRATVVEESTSTLSVLGSLASGSIPAAPDVTCERSSISSDYIYPVIDSTAGTLALFTIDSTGTPVPVLEGALTNAALVGVTSMTWGGGSYDHLIVAVPGGDQVLSIDCSTPSSPSIADTLTDATDLAGVSGMVPFGYADAVYAVGDGVLAVINDTTPSSLSVTSSTALSRGGSPLMSTGHLSLVSESQVYPTIWPSEQNVSLLDLDSGSTYGSRLLSGSPLATTWLNTQAIAVLVPSLTQVLFYTVDTCGVPINEL